MTFTLIVEQLLNGLQFGLMLFLIAAGLTLVFGIMDIMNLAHGSLYMAGVYVAAETMQRTGSFTAAVLVAALATGLVGAVLELTLIRKLAVRDHLAQVLGTYAVILIANDLVKMIWGPAPVMLNMPAALSGPVRLLPDLLYPAYRLMIIVFGLAAAAGLYWFVTRTRAGVLVRAGASNRQMATLMGVRVPLLFLGVFVLAAVAGALLGPVTAVQIGMGEGILILVLVCIVIGGIGSIRGAFVGALLVGMVDTAGRAFLPMLLRQVFPPAVASSVGPTLAAIAIYVLMAGVLVFRPACFRRAGEPCIDRLCGRWPCWPRWRFSPWLRRRWAWTSISRSCGAY
ncbi:branched-chain amino acid ABC transporter permease [Bordetella parapertussis]|uniref:branched-chain amino acid ABC transporter permease n=1 Tax=Bordetella parapertussis TaxID=519 RepID=UPI000F84F697|nr:branched-chain amino acid ABC transporter permease [Bordetella parapertussis]